MCDRQVFNLDGMTDAERMRFMQSCKDEVCVSYSLPLRSMAAAVALSAGAIAMPAAAQDKLIDVDTVPVVVEDLEWCADELELIEIIVGGIKDLDNVEYIDTEEDLEIPELPVTIEDA